MPRMMNPADLDILRPHVEQAASGHDMAPVNINTLARFIHTVDALHELVRHCALHSGYRNCGYAQMTTEQKALYNSLCRAISTPTR